MQWWFISLLGISFPFLLVAVIIFGVLCLLARSRWALLSLACLLLGFTNIRALVGMNFGKEMNGPKPANALRIMSWNVTWFDEQTKMDKSRKVYRDDMLRFISEQQPDLLCFQEYVEPNTTKIPYNNRQDITKLGYPYSMTVVDYTGWRGSFQSGVAIFSKYPITDSIRLIYPGPKNFKAAESLIAVDIDYNGEKIRIFTTHLQSVLFQPNDYANIEKIRTGSDSMYQASKSILNKLGMGYKFRGMQTDIVRRQVDASPYPAIVCGDFNDIPNSYTYFRIRGDRNDAFMEAGKGIGRTFAHLAPTLRIDYIMLDKRFDVLQYSRHLVPYSEHYPIMADVVLRDTPN